MVLEFRLKNWLLLGVILEMDVFVNRLFRVREDGYLESLKRGRGGGRVKEYI